MDDFPTTILTLNKALQLLEVRGLVDLTLPQTEWKKDGTASSEHVSHRHNLYTIPCNVPCSCEFRDLALVGHPCLSDVGRQGLQLREQGPCGVLPGLQETAGQPPSEEGDQLDGFSDHSLYVEILSMCPSYCNPSVCLQVPSLLRSFTICKSACLLLTCVFVVFVVVLMLLAPLASRARRVLAATSSMRQMAPRP